MASDWEGVSLAPGYTMFEASPVWDRIDDVDHRVREIRIRRGRQDEFEETVAGTCEIDIHDFGAFDQTIASDLSGRPGAVAIRNPVTDEWHSLFRGSVDDYMYELSPTQQVGYTTLPLVDMQGYLENHKLYATGGPPGDPPPIADYDYIFYEDTTSDGFQTRIVQALTDAGIPSALMSVFTGNINMPESIYSPGESILTVIIDAAQAEFPTVANFYVDKRGIFQAHGRYARFEPDLVAATASNWEFNRWKAGDGTAIQSDPDRAQIRPPFQFMRSPAFIRNHAICYPKTWLPTVPAPVMANQVFDDAASRAARGTYSWSAENLHIIEGTTTGNTAAVECQLFAQYIIDNYAEPRNRIPQVTFKSVTPDDPRAEATWALICGVDISDVMNIDISHPGGGGFSEDFYVEGIEYSIRRLHKNLDLGYPMVELTLDLSPASYWETSPFPPLPLS